LVWQYQSTIVLYHSDNRKYTIWSMVISYYYSMYSLSAIPTPYQRQADVMCTAPEANCAFWGPISLVSLEITLSYPLHLSDDPWLDHPDKGQFLSCSCTLSPTVSVHVKQRTSVGLCSGPTRHHLTCNTRRVLRIVQDDLISGPNDISPLNMPRHSTFIRHHYSRLSHSATP
jgi:hypothetical protein